jgi:hypothetical protein
LIEPNTVLVLSSAIRQSIAVSFFLLAYNQFFENKFVGFVFFVIIGSLFHSSVIILLILPLFLNGSWNRGIYSIGMYSLILLIFLFLLQSNTNNFILFFIQYFFHYAAYLVDGFMKPRLGFGFYSFLIVSILMAYVLAQSNKSFNDRLSKIILIFTGLNVLLINFNLASRLSFYVLPLLVVAYCRVCYELRTRNPILEGVFALFLIILTSYQNYLFWVSPIYGPYFKVYYTIFQSN